MRSSIRFRPGWEGSYYSALPYLQLFQSRIENGRSNRVYIWRYHTVETPHQIWVTALSGGLFGPSRTCFLKKAILPRRNKHYFEMYQNRNQNRFFWGGAYRAPQTPPPLNLRLRPWFSGALRPRFGLRPQFPLQHACLITYLRSNRGVLDQTLFSPNLNILATPLDPIYRSKSIRSWINLNIPVIISRLGGFSENPAWWTRHTGTYSTQNYCTRSFHFSPECTKIVSGWGSAPDPLGSLQRSPRPPSCYGLGWRVGNNFFGV